MEPKRVFITYVYVYIYYPVLYIRPTLFLSSFYYSYYLLLLHALSCCPEAVNGPRRLTLPASDSDATIHNVIGCRLLPSSGHRLTELSHVKKHNYFFIGAALPYITMLFDVTLRDSKIIIIVRTRVLAPSGPENTYRFHFREKNVAVVTAAAD